MKEEGKKERRRKKEKGKERGVFCVFFKSKCGDQTLVLFRYSGVCEGLIRYR